MLVVGYRDRDGKQREHHQHVQQHIPAAPWPGGWSGCPCSTTRVRDRTPIGWRRRRCAMATRRRAARGDFRRLEADNKRRRGRSGLRHRDFLGTRDDLVGQRYFLLQEERAVQLFNRNHLLRSEAYNIPRYRQLVMYMNQPRLAGLIVPLRVCFVLFFVAFSSRSVRLVLELPDCLLVCAGSGRYRDRRFNRSRMMQLTSVSCRFLIRIYNYILA